MSLPPPDCLRCGVCCFSPSDRFVRVTGTDWTRLGADAERVAQFAGRGNEAFMKMVDGHCAALSVRHLVTGVGENLQLVTEYFCTIYEHRPQICRDLARGSPECAGERAVKAETTSRTDAVAPNETRSAHPVILNAVKDPVVHPPERMILDSSFHSG